MPVPAAKHALKLDGNDPTYGDWRDDLVRDGKAVIKGAVPRERADSYADAMYSWLEDKDKLPWIDQKGMCLQYAVTHEDFAWAIRSEPGVGEAFEKVYDDKDLIVSFDAINFGFPNRTDLPENKPWPHQDQDPLKPGFRCLQGLVNMLPNGPDDGGLIVCRGGHMLSEEYHHASQDDLVRKRDAFERWVGTIHWPNARHTGSNVGKRDGEDDPHNRFEPVNKPSLEQRAFKLTGIPYIKA
ncbi:hypothetical protein D0863_04514 [Hortaea werneckii]|uniref:Uncharacterized protein n=1 Tax=Hortaea werneckii TaxID=91943 RepID=A0A3M7E713_HORWE|nr:hypothetical protein D0863_04514 [Hortaea werneckii]